MRLSKNFTIHEFACKDGTEVPWNLLNEIKALAMQLQVLRDYLAVPITINSAFRNYTYNRLVVKSNDRSQHPKCTAADITAEGYTPAQVRDAIEHLISEDKMQEGGLGIYNTFVHYDIRGTKARWDERT